MKKKLTELEVRTHVWIHTGLLAAGGLVSVLGAKLGERGTAHPVLWLGLGMIIAGILWRVFFVKCPHCGSKLYNVRELPEYCPDCGEKLE